MRRSVVLGLIAVAAAALAPAGRAPAATGPVLMVGDSLTVGTAPYLRRELGALQSDGRTGRSSPEAVGVLRQRFTGSERVVVFDAGTNDDPGQPSRLANDLSAARSITGSRCLVVATINRAPYHGVSVEGLNAAVRRFVSSNSNVQLVDWRSFAVSHPGLIGADGVHPTGAGYAARAQLFAQAIQSCGSGGGGGGGSGGLPPPGTPPPTTDIPPARDLPPASGGGGDRRRGRGGRPAKPKPPKPPPTLGKNTQVFNVEPVTFQSSGARISGEVLAPAGKGRYPAVVMIQGAGEATRTPYREQAEYFAQHGVATFIYDKRGAGQSTGGPDYSYDQLTDDASAAVAMLRRRSDVRPDAVGLWGLSEGAWIAPRVAARDPRIKAVMVVSASALSPAAREDWATRNALAAEGATHGSRPVSLWYRVAADAGRGDLDFDPVPFWRDVAQPVLSVWGADDRLVPVGSSAAALNTALAAGANRDRTFRTFPGASHTLGIAEQSGRPGTAPGFKQLSAKWLRDHLLGRAKPQIAVTPLPPNNGTSVVQVEQAGLLDRWPVQGVWLLLPAVALIVFALRAGLRRRRESDGMPPVADWLPHATVIGLDVAALSALGVAVAAIVSVDGEGVDALAGLPAVVVVAWAIGLVALAATVGLAVWTRRREGASPRPVIAVCAASGVWLLLMAYWLV